VETLLEDKNGYSKTPFAMSKEDGVVTSGSMPSNIARRGESEGTENNEGTYESEDVGDEELPC
jgi:hypothetical protein